MNIVIIPSWYPSGSSPLTGIFFREQAILYARAFPQDRIAIVSWGQNDERLLLKFEWRTIIKLFRRKPFATSRQLAPNLVEYFQPAYTWSRRIANGNLKEIQRAVNRAIQGFESAHGPTDIVHAHVAFPGGYLARAVAKSRSIPFVITEHMIPFPLAGLQWKSDHYVIATLREAQRRIAVSNMHAKLLGSKGVDSITLSNFIDEEFYSSKENILEETFCFLCVGRLEEQKGFSYLIDAAAKVRDQGRRFVIKIIGDGSRETELENQISDLRLEHTVHLLGQKNSSEVLAYLHGCNAFVFPSLYESFGIAPMEALSCGRPVIATKVGEMPDMITATFGTLVETANQKELAKAMIDMMDHIDNYKPQVIRKSFVERYGYKRATKKLRLLFEEVATLHSQGQA